MKKNNCFGFGRMKCSVLKEADCNDCAFYKSQEAYTNDIKKVNSRLLNLPGAVQSSISEKYFKGKMPWSKASECDAL